MAQDRTGGPWWTRWVERGVDRWGLPTVFALILLGALLVFGWRALTGLAEAQTDTREALTKAQTDTQKAIDDHVHEMRVEQAETRWYLRAICFNSANTESERAACVLPTQGR